MGLFRRKTIWERMRDAVAGYPNATTVAKSGFASAASVIGLAAASAVVSSVRRKAAR